MAFIFCQPDIYRNELYQDKIFMQGVRPIGTDIKKLFSKQASTKLSYICSCMSHSNSKIVAISTVKHLSRNYASFQQPSVQEWYSLSTSGQAQSILQRNTADFHGDGYFLQNTGHEAEEISFVVCDVNSEQKRLQVEFLFWSEFFYLNY